MSKTNAAIPDIDKSSNIEKIVRAVGHIRDNIVRTHPKNSAPTNNTIPCAADTDQASNVLTLEQEIALAKETMVEAAFEILEANKHIVSRGYFATHRMIAHLLPKQFAWTCTGIKIVNQLLAESTVTREVFPTWSLEIANHLNEMQEHEAEHVHRVEQFQLENFEQRKIISDEIISLLRNKDERVRNYGKLFNYLHKGLGLGFRGSRGVGIIHEAMREKLKWSSYWEKWMQADMQHAKQHDEEMRNARRLRRASYLDTTKSTEHDTDPCTQQGGR
jgi:hypothetical protein